MLRTRLLPLLFFGGCLGVERLTLPLEIDRPDVRDGANFHQINSQWNQNVDMVSLKHGRVAPSDDELSSMERQDSAVGLSNHKQDQQLFEPSAPSPRSPGSLGRSIDSTRTGSFSFFSRPGPFGSNIWGASTGAPPHEGEVHRDECFICLDGISGAPPETIMVPSTCPHAAHKTCLEECIRKGMVNCAICASPYSTQDFPFVGSMPDGNRGSHLHSGGSNPDNRDLENGEENRTFDHRREDTANMFPVGVSFVLPPTHPEEIPSSTLSSRRPLATSTQSSPSFVCFQRLVCSPSLVSGCECILLTIVLSLLIVMASLILSHKRQLGL